MVRKKMSTTFILWLTFNCRLYKMINAKFLVTENTLN